MDGQQEQPVIISPPQSVTSRLGGQVNLTCIATGVPAPVYQWYRDDELLPGEILPYLLISSVDVGSRGYYRCTATNDVNTARSSPALLALDGKLLGFVVVVCRTNLELSFVTRFFQVTV